MSREPLDLLTFDEPCWLNPPPIVVDEAPPWLDEPELMLDESVPAKEVEDAPSSSSSFSSSNEPGLAQPPITNRRLPVTADFETSQRSLSHQDIVDIHSFFHKIRQEEFERINKKRRMQTAQGGDNSFRKENNQLDMPMASQPMGWSLGKKKWNDWCSSEILLHVPPIASVSKGAANQQFHAATSLTPIAELKELSIEKAPPKTQSAPEVEFPEAGTVDCSTRAGARPTTEADFLASKRKFKPGHEADIASFFDGIRVEEARMMGRPEPAMQKLYWGSGHQGQDWTPLESGAFNTIPDDWGQPDEAQEENLVGLGGQLDEAQENNSGELSANHGNSGHSPPVNTQADFSWNATTDAGEPQQVVTKEHADFSWNDTTDAGPSKMATSEQFADYFQNKTPDAGPSKNARAQEVPVFNRNEVAVAVPSKKTISTKALASKRKAHETAAWESSNSHPHYEVDEYVWGEEVYGSWSARHGIDTGPIIRTRAGNKGRGKRGGSNWGPLN